MTSHAATATEMRDATRLGDPDAIIGVLERVGHTPLDPDLEGIVMDLLWTTSTPVIRNAAAIALADMRSPTAPESLVRLIRSATTKGARGTLLYALEELEASVDLDLIVDLLINDNSEVQAEGLRSIQGGRITYANSQDIRRETSRLRKAITEHTDDDRISNMREAIHLLEALAA